MGFSVPRRLRFARWALTPPFHPYRRRLRNTGGIFSVALSVGTTHAVAARVYLRLNRSYAASRPVVFGLSSRDLRRERFSALPEPLPAYEKGGAVSSRDILAQSDRHFYAMKLSSPRPQPDW